MGMVLLAHGLFFNSVSKLFQRLFRKARREQCSLLAITLCCEKITYFPRPHDCQSILEKSTLGM